MTTFPTTTATKPPLQSGLGYSLILGQPHPSVPLPKFLIERVFSELPTPQSPLSLLNFQCLVSLVTLSSCYTDNCLHPFPCMTPPDPAAYPPTHMLENHVEPEYLAHCEGDHHPPRLNINVLTALQEIRNLQEGTDLCEFASTYICLLWPAPCWLIGKLATLEDLSSLQHFSGA